MRTYIISKSDEGQTVLKYLQRILPKATNGFFYKMFRKKNIVLNDNKKLEGKEKIYEGDRLKLFLSDETIEMFSNVISVSSDEYIKAYRKYGKPGIVYEDEHILIFNKPSGILSQKSKDSDLSANEWLIGYLLESKKITAASLSLFKPSICNRLDRNTSGLMIFAKTLFGANTVNPLIKNRELDKYYITLVHGNFDKEVHDISYLKKDEVLNKVEISDEFKEGFEKIETYFNPLEFIKAHNISLVSVKLITGKTHQIRSTLQKLGYPIVGDRKYGKDAKALENKYKIQNQILHAYKLTFPKLSDYPALSEKTIETEFPQIINMLKE